MSCDPIGIKGCRDVYVYSHNNPVRFADTNGNEPSEQNSQPSGRVSFQAGVQLNIVTEGDKTELHEYSTEAGVYWTPTGLNIPALRLNQDKNAWEPIDIDVSIYEYQQAKAGSGQRLANRISGGIGLIFSGLEAYAGAVIIGGSEGLATAPGWALVVDASDKGAANAKQLITGEVEHSLLYKGVKRVTGSDIAAFITDNAAPIIIAGIAARPAKPSATTTKRMPPDFSEEEPTNPLSGEEPAGEIIARSRVIAYREVVGSAYKVTISKWARLRDPVTNAEIPTEGLRPLLKAFEAQRGQPVHPAWRSRVTLYRARQLQG